MLTRKQMEQVIDNGGSIGYNGLIITDKNDLPRESELARGNPERAAQAKAELDAKIKAAQKELEDMEKMEAEDAKEKKESPEVKSTESPKAEPKSKAKTSSKAKKTEEAKAADASE